MTSYVVIVVGLCHWFVFDTYGIFIGCLMLLSLHKFILYTCSRMILFFDHVELSRNILKEACWFSSFIHIA
jgi:hypothetical protein